MYAIYGTAANPLPQPIYRARTVIYEDSFLMIGGLAVFNEIGGKGQLADIYLYNAEDDEWIKLPAELKKPRSNHVSLLVPQSLFPECT